MTITAPQGVQDILQVMNLHWPALDEDDFRAAADAFTQLAWEITAQRGNVNTAFAMVAPGTSSDAFNALVKRWDQIGGPRLDDIARILNDMSNALLLAADAIVADKVRILATAGAIAAEYTASQVAAALATPETGGLGGLAVEGAEQAAIWVAKVTISHVLNSIESHVISGIVHHTLGGARDDLDRALERLTREAVVKVVTG